MPTDKQPNYNWVYQALNPTKSKNIVGLIAYAIYKGKKIEEIEDFKNRHSGKYPTDKDLEYFKKESMKPETLESYRDGAVQVIQNYCSSIDEALIRKIVSDEIRKTEKSFWKRVWEKLKEDVAVALILYCLYQLVETGWLAQIWSLFCEAMKLGK